MPDKKIDTGTILTKREFLQGFAAIGGVSATFAALNAWGLGPDGVGSAPPEFNGNNKGEKVVILGAGISGMTAAYELSRRGYKVKILEARPFSGGRCQTARSGHKWTDINGETHKCEFDHGEYLNHGPWRIPAHDVSTLHYVKEFNVPMEAMINHNEEVYIRLANAKGGLKNKRVRMKEVIADMRGNTAELLAKVVDQGKLNDIVDGDAKEQLMDYLIREGHLEKKELSYVGHRSRGYKVNPGAGTNPGPGVPSDPYLLKDLLASGLGNKFSSVAASNEFQPVGGMDQIAKAFDKQVGRWITHNAEVLEIRQDENGVRIPYKNTRTGKVREEKADYCISTVPPTIINHLPLDLSSEAKEALKVPSGFKVSKMGLQMNRRFWEEDDHIYGGQGSTDTPLNGTLSYPSQGLFSKKGVLLAGYHFGGAANKVSTMGKNKRIELALKNGEMLHPGAFRKHYTNKYAYKAWHTTKYSMGGWESFAGSKEYRLLLEAQGRVYFAGQYMSYKPGWLSGAIESAWQQVARLHKDAALRTS